MKIVRSIGLLACLVALAACQPDENTTEAVNVSTEPVQTETATEQDTEETEAATETTEAATENDTEDATEDTADAAELAAEDFFFADTDWHAVYTNAQGKEESRSTQYTQDNLTQVRHCDGTDCYVEIWETGGDFVALNVSATEGWFRKNLITDGYENLLDSPFVYLKGPIEVGNRWQTGPWDFEITEILPANGDTGVRVVVTEDGGDTYTYEEGRWLVDENSETRTITQTDYHQEAAKMPVRLYYPAPPEDERDHFLVREVEASFPVNSVSRKILEDLYKNNVPEGGVSVLKEEDTINSLYLNQDGNVYVDLSASFSNMNAGSSGEPLILKAMAFTAAGLMNGNGGVVLTLDNQLYEGGHVSFEQGETLPAVPGDADTVTEIE